MKNKFLLLVSIILLTSCNTFANTNPSSTSPTSTASAWPSDTSTIPSGFTWKTIDDLSIGFLIPDNWYYKEEKNGNVYAYFVTKEDIDKEKIYLTGMTINVMAFGNVAPDEFAKGTLDNLANAETTRKVIKTQNTTQGGYIIRELQIEAEYPVPDEDPSHYKTLFYRTIADTKSPVLYFVFFESPTSIWEDEWKKGQLMIQIAVPQ